MTGLLEPIHVPQLPGCAYIDRDMNLLVRNEVGRAGREGFCVSAFVWGGREIITCLHFLFFNDHIESIFLAL